MGACSLFFFSCSLGLRAGCRRFCGRICVGDGALLALLEGFRTTDSQLVSMFVALGSNRPGRASHDSKSTVTEPYFERYLMFREYCYYCCLGATVTVLVLY